MPFFMSLINQPYVTGNDLDFVTDRHILPASSLSHYYPRENEPVVKIHLNTNFANGPSFNGKKFVFPDVPYSTRGQQDGECDKESDELETCTHIIDVKYGSIVEMTITNYAHTGWRNFHHLIHLHGHEMFVLASGTGTVNATTNRIEPQNGHPAFKCKDDSIRCHLSERNADVPIGLSS